MRYIPNICCLSRIMLTIPIVIAILINTPWSFLVATILFILASVTDILDGFLARRLGLVSSFGAFFDLTADKVFMSCILIALIQASMISTWIVIIIIAREFIVTGIRSMAQTRGKVIPAGNLGKQKTVILSIAVFILLLNKGLKVNIFSSLIDFFNKVPQINEILLLISNFLLLLSVCWTIISGSNYIISALPILQEE